jgi:lysyl-tRNA synthetase class 2
LLAILPHLAHKHEGDRYLESVSPGLRPASAVPFTTRRPRVDPERYDKLQQLRLQGPEPFPDVHLRSRSLAATIYASHDPRTLDPGEHLSWRYTVAGRLVARRKHRHATFFDLRDQSGVIELCARRDHTNHPDSRQLLAANIGDILAAEGTVYVTDNHKLTLSVLASRLLTKALRPPPTRTNGTTATGAGSHQREPELLTDEQARIRVIARSELTASVRDWMRQNLFLEVSSCAPSRLHLRRCLLSGLERVYELKRCFGSDGSQVDGANATTLAWSAAYIDCKESARQTETLIQRAVAAIAPDMRVSSRGRSIDLRGPWRSTTLRQGILEQTGIDILAADANAIARQLPSSASAAEGSWASLVNRLYAEVLEPRLIEPTIVYDFPLAPCALVRRHPVHRDLADCFRVVIGGAEVARGESELNDPEELWARVNADKDSFPGEHSPAAAYQEEEVRLLEYGLFPAASANAQLERLLLLLTDNDTMHDAVPLRLLTDSR